VVVDFVANDYFDSNSKKVRFYYLPLCAQAAAIYTEMYCGENSYPHLLAEGQIIRL